MHAEWTHKSKHGKNTIIPVKVKPQRLSVVYIYLQHCQTVYNHLLHGIRFNLSVKQYSLG